MPSFSFALNICRLRFVWWYLMSADCDCVWFAFDRVHLFWWVVGNFEDFILFDPWRLLW